MSHFSLALVGEKSPKVIMTIKGTLSEGEGSVQSSCKVLHTGRFHSQGQTL